MPGRNRRPYTQVYLSEYDFLLPPNIKGLKFMSCKVTLQSYQFLYQVFVKTSIQKNNTMAETI